MLEILQDLFVRYVDPLLPDWVKLVFAIFFTTSYLTSVFCSRTTTPPINTLWGKIYKYIEIYSGMWGKAKELGLPVPANLTEEELKQNVQQLAEDIEKGK